VSAGAVVVGLGRRPGLGRMQGCRIRRMPGTIEGSGEVSVLRVGLEDVSVRSSVGVGC
jgi:hypothetical protein